MARIDEYLQKILSARYGEEVRGAIHDSIDEINRVNEANISTVQAIADTAQGYADDAEDSKDLAAQSVTDAQAQVTLAQQQVTLATTQATNSANSAEDSEAWAVGQRSGIDVPSSDETYQNNSKYWQERANYWYQQAQAIAESFSGALRPIGTVTFENLPPLAQADSGDMYNISNQFTTTSDFVEGAGIVVPLGSNVYKTTGGKWDVLAGSPVTGVKGNSESSYRRGNVNITKSNIGLGNVDNTSDANKPISIAQQAALDLKQNITDNSLTTTNKTIPGAINEINNDLDVISGRPNIRVLYFDDNFNTTEYGTAHLNFTPLITQPFTRLLGVFFIYSANMATNEYAPIATMFPDVPSQVEVLGLPKNATDLNLKGYALYM